jgi:hypothetical protein
MSRPVPGVRRYRPRGPVLIDAIQVVSGNEDAVWAFVGGHYSGPGPALGDYFVRGITGHFFIVNADQFAATYELANGDEEGNSDG